MAKLLIRHCKHQKRLPNDLKLSHPTDLIAWNRDPYSYGSYGYSSLYQIVPNSSVYQTGVACWCGKWYGLDVLNRINILYIPSHLYTYVPLTTAEKVVSKILEFLFYELW